MEPMSSELSRNNIGSGHPFHRGGEFTDVLVWLNRTGQMSGTSTQELLAQFTGLFAKRNAMKFIQSMENTYV